MLAHVSEGVSTCTSFWPIGLGISGAGFSLIAAASSLCAMSVAMLYALTDSHRCCCSSFCSISPLILLFVVPVFILIFMLAPFFDGLWLWRPKGADHTQLDILWV